MKAISWLVAFLVVLLEGCMPSSREGARLLSFHTLPEPARWAVGDRPAYLVVTEGNWSIYYSNSPDGSDFRRFIYVVVSLGMKPNAGYTVNIRQTERAKDVITIRVELNEPDPQKMYAQVLVHPIAVAQIAKADLDPPGLLNAVFVDQKGRRLATVKVEI